MNKQEHIEAVEQVIWSWLQSHYQESCYTTELGKFTDALCDFWKIYNDNKDEIKQLKAENEESTKVVSLKVYDFVNNIIDETNIRLEIEKQAKIEVLNELKKEYGFYSCYSFKNDVKSLSEIIDELIKEYEK